MMVWADLQFCLFLFFFDRVFSVFLAQIVETNHASTIFPSFIKHHWAQILELYHAYASFARNKLKKISNILTVVLW